MTTYRKYRMEIAQPPELIFAAEPHYVRRPFQREHDFGALSVTYKLGVLLAGSGGLK